MSGTEVHKCIMCNNIEGKNLVIDGKPFEGCNCSKGKYIIDGVQNYFTVSSLRKDIKPLKEIEDKCELWDYKLKPKV